MCSLFCANIHLSYVRIHVIYRAHQAEYVLHIVVVAPQEYVNIYLAFRERGLVVVGLMLMLATKVGP